MKRLMVFMLAWGICANAACQPLNNLIFSGGSGDGWDKRTYQQAGSNIFTGGSGDGWNINSFSQQANNIFTGGNGDGWNRSDFSQQANNIFKGGDGDGWNMTVFAQQANNIFTGGNGDGWDKTTFAQTGNNIFPGGIGDGWSSAYRPQAPLPVTLLYFTARKNSASSSLLEWKTSQELNTSRFEIERSNDAINFNNIGSVNAAGNSSTSIEYSFTDNNPAAGNNYYRLKQFDLDGRFTYTPARLVRFDDLNSASVKFYPNPVHGILTIERTGTSAEQMLINISNVSGQVVDQVRIPTTADRKIFIDMKKYGKGIYFIQLKSATINSTERIISE